MQIRGQPPYSASMSHDCEWSDSHMGLGLQRKTASSRTWRTPSPASTERSRRDRSAMHLMQLRNDSARVCRDVSLDLFYGETKATIVKPGGGAQSRKLWSQSSIVGRGLCTSASRDRHKFGAKKSDERRRRKFQATDDQPKGLPFLSSQSSKVSLPLHTIPIATSRYARLERSR